MKNVFRRTWGYWWRSRFGAIGLNLVAGLAWMALGGPRDYRVCILFVPIDLAWFVYALRWKP